LSKSTENDGATQPGRRLVNQQKLPPGWDAVKVETDTRHIDLSLVNYLPIQLE
jgi:hypothetical protein